MALYDKLSANEAHFSMSWPSSTVDLSILTLNSLSDREVLPQPTIRKGSGRPSFL
jgi:hypothetical protein